jgi:hypothetical protein
MRSDRFGAYNLTAADEPLYRALRDGFRGAGLSRAQFTQALEWYRDHVRPGMDDSAMHESFHEFATNKGWDVAQIVGAQSIHAAVRDQGPDAITATPTAEEDAATIERATELLRKDPDAYWKDQELQEAQFEALERREAATAAPATALVVDDYAIERQLAQREVQKYETVLRERPSEYWRDTAMQAAYRNAIERSTASAPIAPAIAPAPTGEPAPAAPTPVAPAPSAEVATVAPTPARQGEKKGPRVAGALRSTSVMKTSRIPEQRSQLVAERSQQK